MKKFFIKNKVKILVGLGIVGTGSVAVTGIALSGVVSSGVEDNTLETDDDIFEESDSVRPTLTAHKRFDLHNLASKGTKLTDRGYVKHNQGLHLALANLGWRKGEINDYPQQTIGYKLKQQNVPLIGEHASPSVWQDMAWLILDDHSKLEDSFLNNYSVDFRALLLGMRHDWRDKETRKQTWGEDLKKICLANYRKEYYDKETQQGIVNGIGNLCAAPTLGTEGSIIE